MKNTSRSPFFLKRRSFLKGLGMSAVGTSLFGPLLNQVYAQSCFDSADIPRRFVIVMQGNGIETHNFLSDAAKSARNADANHASSLVVDDLTGSSSNAMRSIQGADGELDLTPHALAAVNFSSKIAGGSHTTEFKALSCSKGRQETFDNWLARTLHKDQPFASLKFGVTESKESKLQYNISVSDSGRNLPIIVNPTDAHSTLFGSIAAGSGGKEFALQSELLDFASKDVKAALDGFSGSSQERLKLESYLLSLEELKVQQERLITSSDCLAELASSQGIDPNDGSILNAEHPLDRLRAQFKLGTAALLGNMTSVLVLTNSVGYSFGHTKYSSLSSIFAQDPDFEGTIPWRHGVAHRDPAAAPAEICQQVLDRVIEVQVEEVTKLARTLASVPEGNGTMLDHTVILFMSDNGDVHHSSAANWPMLLLGGSALGLKTGGRTLFTPKLGNASNQRVSHIFNTLATLAKPDLDVDSWQWGGEPDKYERRGVVSEMLT